MKIRATLLLENDSPISVLGENPEEKIRKVYKAILALAMLKNPGDRGVIEKIEIVEEEE
jgi:hypothetical protein